MPEPLLKDGGTASNKLANFSEFPMGPTSPIIPDLFIYEYTFSSHGKKVIMMDRDLKSFIDFIDEEVSTGWRERIEQNTMVLVGKPVVRGTRIAVDLILDMLSGGWSEKDIIDNYPQLTSEDIRACLSYAGVALRRGLLAGKDCLPR